MYSVVLMAALTTSVDLPERHRGGGCCGCYGGGYGGCYGGGWGGGYGCCGCYGGGWGGGFGYGCMGYGGGYGGCMGYGGGFGGCMGYGMAYGGCMGCYGGYGLGGFGYGGGIIMPGTGTGTGTGGERAPMPGEKKTGGRKETMAPAPATIVVELPADARLLIDNEATAAIGSSRVFQSPALNPGKAYHYTLKAEVVRDGKTVKAEQVVTVKAGEVTPVTLTIPAAGVAQR